MLLIDQSASQIFFDICISLVEDSVVRFFMWHHWWSMRYIEQPLFFQQASDLLFLTASFLDRLLARSSMKKCRHRRRKRVGICPPVICRNRKEDKKTWIENLLLFAHLEFSWFRRLWMPAAEVAARHHPSMCSRSTHVARIEMKNEPEFPFFSTKCTNSTHETDPWTSCLSWIHKSILSYHRVLHGYMLALL